MIIINRACLLALFAMLSLSPLGHALADPAIKPALTGLISTGSTSNTLKKLAAPNAIGIFGGLVVQATWNDFQPDNGDELITTVIDDALTDLANNNVTNYNATVGANGRQIGVRLRIFAGCSDSNSDAPPWAMQSDAGFPITVWAQYNSAPESCVLGKFWDTNSNYAQAWRNFQAKLAAKYDSNPLIQEISVTSCTSFSAEPFFLNLKPPQFATTPNPVPPLPPAAFGAAGFTDAAYRECLMNAVDDYSAWQTTRLEFSFNGFSGLGGQNDMVTSELIMRRCRLTLGPRCILSNHDLDATTPTSLFPIYIFERRFGPNITFQSLYEVPSDFEGTLRKGISFGASSIEIWQEPAIGTFENQPRTTLTSWAQMFQPQ